MTLDELRAEAKKLRNEKNYIEAIRLYRKIWEEFKEERNKWDGWGYAYCLRKTNKYIKAIDVSKSVYKMDSKFQYNNNLLAWIIFELKIREEIQDEEDFLDSANYILRLSDQDNKYSPYIPTVFKVINYYKQNYGKNASIISDWLDRLDKKHLSTESKNGYPSQLEKWYTEKSKNLYYFKKYEECSDICIEALNNNIEFHNSNNIWLMYRKALSDMEVGHSERALNEFKDLLIYKREWFIQRNVAQLYYNLGDLCNSKKYALDAALNYNGDYTKKVMLYELLFDIIKKSDINLAKKHLILAYKIRKEKEWRITREILSYYNQLKIKNDNLSSYDLYKNLKKIWINERSNYNDMMKGEVISILSKGKAGFIKGNNEKEYYFKSSAFIDNKIKIKRGLKIRFNLAPSFDKNKNKKTEMAVNIIKI